MHNQFVCFLILLYQKIVSPHFLPCCRLAPSCSSYALTAYSRFAFFKATYLTIQRLFSCHPFGSQGFDPVPKK